MGEEIVFDGVYAKFSQNDDLKEQVLKTGNKLLAEASPYDRIWGIGLSKNDPNANQNLLGSILMKEIESKCCRKM